MAHAMCIFKTQPIRLKGKFTKEFQHKTDPIFWLIALLSQLSMISGIFAIHWLNAAEKRTGTAAVVSVNSSTVLCCSPTAFVQNVALIIFWPQFVSQSKWMRNALACFLLIKLSLNKMTSFILYCFFIFFGKAKFEQRRSSNYGRVDWLILGQWCRF